jgi:predicted RNA binding protein YcfA (HicA-like mRNA interferase family)
MKPKKLKTLLKQHGWTLERYGKGDHEIWTNGTQHITLDPGASEIPIGLLKATLKFAGIELASKSKKSKRKS